MNSRHETFADWQEENKTGVIYYLKDGHVRGAMMCNLFGKVDAARELERRPASIGERPGFQFSALAICTGRRNRDCQRQAHRKGAALSKLALYRDCAVMAFNDVTCAGQPDPQPGSAS